MQGLGYQPVYKSELYAEAASGSIFGFAPRYADYLFQPDVVSGDLVLTGTKTGMDGYHTFRQFTSVPTLTPTFTQIRPADRDELDSRIFNTSTDGSSHEIGTCWDETIAVVKIIFCHNYVITM